MKILLGMSGGVDSTVAAKILLSEGHEVTGAVLKMHEYTELSEAQRAAMEVGINIVVIDCTSAFSQIVKANFVSEYTEGRTPNPCIICNERVKMKFLYDYALKNGFDKIATGHYARIVRVSDNGRQRCAVASAADSRKDQSYMLYRLPEEILRMLCLPLRDTDKESVRALASETGVSAADRRDSQEICFLPCGGHAEYVESVSGAFPEGDFVDTDGRVIGRHKGIVRYTVGQRKGLGVALGERMFVTEINPKKNTVTLAPSFSGDKTIYVKDMVFSGMDEPAAGTERELLCKIRYSTDFIPARVVFLGNCEAHLEFEIPVKAAPGQSAVLYSGGVIMGGGVIDFGPEKSSCGAGAVCENSTI